MICLCQESFLPLHCQNTDLRIDRIRRKTNHIINYEYKRPCLLGKLPQFD
jgi:hypothetical protein